MTYYNKLANNNNKDKKTYCMSQNQDIYFQIINQITINSTRKDIILVKRQDPPKKNYQIKLQEQYIVNKNLTERTQNLKHMEQNLRNYKLNLKKQEFKIEEIQKNAKEQIQKLSTFFYQTIMEQSTDLILQFANRKILQSQKKYQDLTMSKLQQIHKNINIEFKIFRLKQQLTKIQSETNLDFKLQDYINFKDEFKHLQKAIQQIKQQYTKVIENSQALIMEWTNRFKELRQKNILDFKIKQNKILKIRYKLIKINKELNLPRYRTFNEIDMLESNINDYQQVDYQADFEYTTLFGIKVDINTFKSLTPGGWITSSIILNYIQYLKLTKLYNTQNNKRFILSQSQFGSMDNPKTFYQNNIKQKFRSLIQDFDLVGIIVNKNNQHWYFIGIDTKSFEILIYNSIRQTESSYEHEIRTIKNYLKYQSTIINQYQSIKDFKFTEKRGQTVLQRNGSDCGLCTLINMTMFLEQKFDKKVKSINYEYEKIQKLRKGFHYFICYLIYCKQKGKFLNLDYLDYCSSSIILSQNWKSLF